MKKNILIIGLAGILGISSGLISCSPDYETEFNVETLVVPDKSQFFRSQEENMKLKYKQTYHLKDGVLNPTQNGAR